MSISISRAQLLRGAIAGLATAVIGGPALAQQGVNGRNVTWVKTPNSTMTLSPGGRWREQGRDGNGFDFTEDQRDDWSVYLTDRSRGVRLQIDLHRGKILYADSGAPQMRDLYDITGSSAVVNGRNVIRVVMPQGSYLMTGQGRWREQGNDGGGFDFTEDRRDDWSVYLSDRSRGVQLQLDLHTRKVMYSDTGAPSRRPLYDITGANAV